mmetsp:Transcript_9114/g.17171  ORF Transcript_9114/g.17171 Transcript_9114/m.17171 type:complete len:107 (+) Transcript_9114:602-922(+)
MKSCSALRCLHRPLPPAKSTFSNGAVVFMWGIGRRGSAILFRVKLNSRRFREAVVISAGELLESPLAPNAAMAVASAQQTTPARTTQATLARGELCVPHRSKRHAA